jgi:glucosylceramidase
LRDEAVPQTGPGDVILRSDKVFQTIAGFGGAFTDAAAYTLSRVPDDVRSEAIRAYFDPRYGLAYSLGRVPVHSCDFSRETYTYVDDNDRSLGSFTLEREEDLLFPLIRDAEAVRGAPVPLLASPWSPPAWMKDNADMCHGGSLLPEFRQTWADYLVRYTTEMRSRHFSLWALSVQNEPAAVQTWESCIYSAEQERDFVRDYLGPALHEHGLGDTALLVWDHNRDIIAERVKTVLEDPEAARYVWGVGFHWYEGEQFEEVGAVHDRYPDTHLLFTEGCQEGGPHPGSWPVAERYARNMIGDFNNWCEGHIDWNLVLDQTGGPNHVGNLCDAPVLADTTTGQLTFNPSYFAIGHFSKFVVPGSRRIGLEGDRSWKGTAFETPGGSIIAVLLNDTDFSVPYSVSHDGERASGDLPEHSILTLVWGEDAGTGGRHA